MCFCNAMPFIDMRESKLDFSVTFPDFVYPKLYRAKKNHRRTLQFSYFVHPKLNRAQPPATLHKCFVFSRRQQEQAWVKQMGLDLDPDQYNPLLSKLYICIVEFIVLLFLCGITKSFLQSYVCRQQSCKRTFAMFSHFPEKVPTQGRLLVQKPLLAQLQIKTHI